MNSYLLVALVSEFASGATILAWSALPPFSTFLATRLNPDHPVEHNDSPILSSCWMAPVW